MISFLIVNWNGGEIFKQSIESIYSNISEFEHIEYEIVVIDNNSNDLDENWIRNKPNLRFYKNSRNLFFAKATNQSVKYSKGDILFILNNDIILQRSCLKKLIFELNNNKIDAVVPKFYNFDNTVQHSISGLPTPMDIFYISSGVYKVSCKYDKWLMKKYCFDYSKKQFVVQPLFSALVLNRETWENIGQMDETFPLLFNDVDWFYRFHQKNLKCLFVPEAKVFHVHGMSVNKNIIRKVYHSTMSMIRFFHKYNEFNFFNCILLPYIVVVVPIFRIFRDYIKKIKILF